MKKGHQQKNKASKIIHKDLFYKYYMNVWNKKDIK